MTKRSTGKRKQPPISTPDASGLGVGNSDPPSIKDSDLAKASTWWQELRGTWRLSSSSDLDLTFVPSSLNRFSIHDVRKYGNKGIHFAEGWAELYRMIDKNGLDYSPSLTVPEATTTPSDTNDTSRSNECGADSLNRILDRVDHGRSNLVSPQLRQRSPMRQYENRVLAVEDVAFGKPCSGGLKVRVESLEVFIFGRIREDGGLEARLTRLENPAVMREADSRLAALEAVVFGDISRVGLKIRLNALDRFRFGQEGNTGSIEERLARLEA